MTTYTTPNYALRAPNDDELAKNGASAMRNLANDVDAALAAEMASLPSDTVRTVQGSTVGTPNVFGWLTVNFPAGSFSSAPVVVVTNGDMAAFQGFTALLGPATSTSFTAVCVAATSHALNYTRAYAEWVIANGETTTGIRTRLRAGATGAPTAVYAAAGNIRINWIAVGPG